MRWSKFFRRSRWDAERSAEIDTYLAVETDDNIARGMTPEEARCAALRKFGNVTQVREEIYRMNTARTLQNFVQDVTYGLRTLRNSPGFTAVAIASLALGIGANTAIFSLVDTLMLRMLPVTRPHELVQLGIAPNDPKSLDKSPRASNSFSYPIFEEIRDGGTVFTDVFAHAGVGAYNILIDGHQERVSSERTTGAYFSTLGVTPALGRTFGTEMDRPGAEPAAVISYGYWQRRFGQDPSVLGKKFALGRTVFTIIGVAPTGFTGIVVDRQPDLWLPLTTTGPAEEFWGPKARTRWSPHIIGRLKPGLLPSQADAPINALFAGILENDEALSRARDTGRRIPESAYAAARARKLVLQPAGRGVSTLRMRYSQPLMVLTAVAGLVLLIACVNIANLLLARTTARRREMAIRLAIGASRGRLILQLLTESLMLSLAGAAVGLLFAFWAGNTLIDMIVDPSRNSAMVAYRLDGRLLGFTAGIATLTGILFGLGPAIRATRINLTPALKNEPAAARGGRITIAKVLVISQVALSLTLLLGAVLFVSTLQRLLHQDLGFRADSLLAAGFVFDEGGPKGPHLPAAYRDLLERVQTMPGVESATLSQYAFLSGSGWSEPVYPDTAGAPPQRSLLQFVAPNFFETMRMPLILGRAFTARDDATAPKAIIVNETLARRLFPDGPAVGRRIGWTPQTRSEVEIVGVVSDSRYSNNLRQGAEPFSYLPMAQPQTSPYGQPMDGGTLQVRAHGNPTALVEPLRRTLQAARVRPGNIRTQDFIIGAAVRQERLLAEISGFFGVVGLLLAVAGVYGLMAYTVSRRTGEMGIRMALGARPGEVVRMVLRESAVLVLAGVTAGTALSIAATRLIEALLFGVTRTDPGPIGLAAGLLVAAGLAAALFPALRAARVSPMMTLRHE